MKNGTFQIENGSNCECKKNVKKCKEMLQTYKNIWERSYTIAWAIVRLGNSSLIKIYILHVKNVESYKRDTDN